jgi:nitroimidazol reductase NimA-like FMN-containing flavoprotein (pyridoxamine 5'-phosphate oxidase superfamily)
LPEPSSFRMADRTTFHVHPERSAPGEISAILAAGVVAHVGLVDPRGPVVIPMSYHYDVSQPDRLYLHGAPHSPLLQAASAGGKLCVTVTLLDGLVYSRTALYHSVNYRSVVCFGHCALASDDERGGVLEAMIARYYPGRAPGRDYDPMPNAHLEATVLIAMHIEAASAKVRRGGPKGPRDTDPLASGTAGVVDFPRLELPFQR